MTDSTCNEDAPIRWVVMGVSGCGKSELGNQLATALGVPFVEGDLFHPIANVAKMSSGMPLNDGDRVDWLLALQEQIGAARARNAGLVLSCSALKRRYRDVLRAADPALRFAHPMGERDVIAERMQERIGHYMPLSLLDSQLRDLEPLQADEQGIVLDISKEPRALVAEVMRSQTAARSSRDNALATLTNPFSAKNQRAKK